MTVVFFFILIIWPAPFALPILMKRIFAVLCLLFSLVVSNALAPLDCVQAQQQQSTVSNAVSTLRVTGLRARVTIRRDGRGIPYIEASNEADLYFAQGYVTAADRLWQMDLLRRTARGELAEIFGQAALAEDKRRRVFGFANLAESMALRAAPELKAMLEAYARGVNALIESRDGDSLPLEFKILQYRPRAWTPADSLLIGKIFAEVLSTTWNTDIMRAALANLPAEKRDALLPEFSPLDVLVVGARRTAKKRAARARAQSRNQISEPNARAVLRTSVETREILSRSLERIGLDAQERAASNNWVVSGKRTASGKPLLANDPHLTASAPSIWYMTELSAPTLHVAGVTTPGAPGIILGHNEHIAWGATNLGPDVQDLYLEKFDPANPQRYMTPAGWREATVRREEIKVRTSPADTTTQTVVFAVTTTRHGPIFLEKNSTRYALRWTALDADAMDAETIYRLNRARDWKDFRAAFKNYGGPVQNFIYADVDGHIGYYGAGRIPVRKSGDGSLPYDGSTDAGEWIGFIPFDRLPQVYNPPSGMIVTANQRIIGHDYPFHLTHEWAAPYRAQRIQDLLQAKTKLTVEDFRSIQADTFSYAGANFARALVKLARQENNNAALVDEKWRDTVQLLANWDGHVDRDSRAALITVLMRDAFRKRIIAEALGPDLARDYKWGNVNTFIDRILAEQPREWLPKEFKSYPELMRACEKDARAQITQRLGTDESGWTWGGFQQFRFPHPLARVPLVGLQFAIPPVPQHGSISSVNVGQNVSMRLIADTSDWDKTLQGITLGQSGERASAHWSDQLKDWINVTPRTFPFSGKAITAATNETLLLEPARPS